MNNKDMVTQQEAAKLKQIYNFKKKDLGISQESLAYALGISQGAIAHYLNGRNPLNPRIASEFSKILGVHVSEFSPRLANEISNQMFAIGPKEDLEEHVKTRSKQEFKVDLLDVQASAGVGVYVRDEFIETIRSIEYTNEEAKHLFKGRRADDIKMITVSGDSMKGTFDPQDLIFVDTTVNYFQGDGIYVFVLKEKIYVKRLQLMFDKLAIISDNKAYETFYLTEEKMNEIKIVGKVLISQTTIYKLHG